jgi:hypothetical protein
MNDSGAVARAPPASKICRIKMFGGRREGSC